MKNYQNVILIVLGIFALTNPSETDHDNAVINRDSTAHPIFSEILKQKTTKINLVIFSFTQIQQYDSKTRENMEKKIIGLGILGNVILFDDTQNKW